MPRKVTTQVINALDEGLLDYRTVLNAALSYLSEADVADMVESYELFPYTIEEEG